MKYAKALGLLAAALAVMPVASYAQQFAYTSKDVNLRAGPARDYPVVAVLQAGASVSVEGCVSGYRWCDVVAGPYRGWVYAGNLVYPYQGSNVPVLTYGAMIGIGLIGFSIGDYWDQYYRGSPWYPQRQRWIDRPQPGFGPGGRYPLPPSSRFGPGGGQRPPHVQGPSGGQRAPQTQGPGGSPRAPQRQGQDGR